MYIFLHVFEYKCKSLLLFFFRRFGPPGQSLALLLRERLAGLLAEAMDEGDPAAAHQRSGEGPGHSGQEEIKIHLTYTYSMIYYVGNSETACIIMLCYEVTYNTEQVTCHGTWMFPFTCCYVPLRAVTHPQQVFLLVASTT